MWGIFVSRCIAPIAAAHLGAHPPSLGFCFRPCTSGESRFTMTLWKLDPLHQLWLSCVGHPFSSPACLDWWLMGGRLYFALPCPTADSFSMRLFQFCCHRGARRFTETPLRFAGRCLCRVWPWGKSERLKVWVSYSPGVAVRFRSALWPYIWGTPLAPVEIAHLQAAFQISWACPSMRLVCVGLLACELKCVHSTLLSSLKSQLKKPLSQISTCNLINLS